MESAATGKPSGIPRPATTGIPRPTSRLPTLKTKSSQTLTREIAYNPTAATPKLRQRASIASFTRASLSDLRDAINSGQPTSNRIKPSKASIQGHNAQARSVAVRPLSRGNEQRLPQPKSKPVSPEDGENDDQLTSLEATQTTSRHGWRHEASPLEDREQGETMETPARAAKPRPSLSDRTIESLQNLPATPKDKRKSGFFAPMDSPMARPSSASSKSSGINSRPGTSDGTASRSLKPGSPAKRTPASAKSTRVASASFGYRPSSSQAKDASNMFRAQHQDDHVPPVPRIPSPAIISALPVTSSTKTPLNTMNGATTTHPRQSRSTLNSVSTPKRRIAASESERYNDDPKAEQARRTVSASTNSSSAALREQIAAAKAAARKERARKHDSPRQSEFDLGHPDPFNQTPKDSNHILRNRIRSAWRDGKLNISDLGLKALPVEVLNMYDSVILEESNMTWAEVVDLTRLNAANNKLSDLESAFPDVSPHEEYHPSQFGGLESLDVHGNILTIVPLGLRRLERLTVLQLAHNKLDNACFGVVEQISSLKELNLSHNCLTGALPSSICKLRHLERLDLQSNRILSLPESLRELTSLQVLHVAGNQLTAVPMEALHEIPLVELDASNNALIASLFPMASDSSHPTLRILNVANNSLAALTFSENLSLPGLRTLVVSNNSLTELPGISACSELQTLAASGCRLAQLPRGFTSLMKLRHASFANNELRQIDPQIATMESLEVLDLAANPLRPDERRYLTMTAAEVKRDLLSKLSSATPHQEHEQVDGPPKSTTWSIQAKGVLDLASRSLTDDINDSLGSFLRSEETRELRLSNNVLTVIPPALWLGQDLRILDLSNNPFEVDFVGCELELPVLQELNLSRCRLTVLEPLTSQLSAPSLCRLILTANRLSGAVPALRATFPALTMLLASDNKFASVDADALRGLETVDLANNDLQHLSPAIGLLWDEGLRHFSVSGNAFRVPNHAILSKGTEATMRWLRNKLPAGQDQILAVQEEVDCTL